MNLYFPHFPALPEEPRPPSLPTREADICLSAGWIIFHTTSSSSFFKHNFQEHRPSRQKTGRKYYKNCKNSTLVPGIVILQQLEQQRQREEAEKQRDSRVRFFRNGCCRLERHGNVNLRSAWMCCGKKTRRTNPQLPGDTKSILFFIHVTLWSINIILLLKNINIFSPEVKRRLQEVILQRKRKEAASSMGNLQVRGSNK